MHATQETDKANQVHEPAAADDSRAVPCDLQVSWAVPVPGLVFGPGQIHRHSDPDDVLGGTELSPEFAGLLTRRRGRGQPLPPEIARSMGDAMGADLDSVRIHTGAEPAELARSVQATAFTQGTDIYFGAGSYAPHTPRGQRLLAHELAHTVQPGTGVGQGPIIGRASDPAEAAADRVADGVLGILRRRAVSAGSVQRDEQLRESLRSTGRTAPLAMLRAMSPAATPVLPASLPDGWGRGTQNDGGDTVSPAQQVTAGPAGGDNMQVRRKVGFELELKLDLHKGRMTTEPRKAPKKKKQKEQFVGWGSQTESFGESAPLITEEKESGPIERPVLAEEQNITKGETILPGQGWRLTPDGADGDWYPEFITDAVDEDKAPTRPGEIMGGIANFVTKNWGTIVPGKYLQLPRDFLVGKPMMASRFLDLGANIHFTVGVRPEKVLELMALLTKAKNGPLSEKDIVDTKLEFEEIEPIQTKPSGDAFPIDQPTQDILKRAVAEGQKIVGDPIYQGVVALMGSYIAGELRTAVTLNQTHQNLSKKLKYCIDQQNLKEFVLTGKITDTESLKFINEKYKDFGEFAVDLRESLEGTGPSTAKLQVPVLSRSSLAELRGKTTINNFNAFLTDVTKAAGLTVQQAQFPLFPLGISNPHRKRTVEANPDITVAQWVKTVFDGENLTFTDEVKSFEKVGPSVPGCLCWCETRAKGAVLEIRALDEKRRIAPEFWADLADQVVAMMRELNDD